MDVSFTTDPIEIIDNVAEEDTLDIYLNPEILRDSHVGPKMLFAEQLSLRFKQRRLVTCPIISSIDSHSIL